jgi:small subunit ribosomal protein S16
LLRIRLARVGKKKQPAYRIVVADSRAPREGAFIKIIGHYNPLTNPATLTVKEEEAVQWLQKGAQPSDTAAKLLTGWASWEGGLAPVRTWARTCLQGRRARRPRPLPRRRSSSRRGRGPSPVAEEAAPAGEPAEAPRRGIRPEADAEPAEAESTE